MRKYSVGQKFVIEIGAERLGDPTLYRIKGFNTLVFDDNGLNKLERYDADAKANADYNSGYEDGLRDAWECAKKISLLDDATIEELFGTSKYNRFNPGYNGVEIKKLLEEYEAKQAEIKVGDEVIDSGDKGVVTYTDNSINVCDVLWYDGSVSEEFEKKILRKTGRHYDIDGILEQLKGADE